MPEPHSTTIGIAVGAGIGLTGTVMGDQVDALIIGLVAAILISFWLPTIDAPEPVCSAMWFSNQVLHKTEYQTGGNFQPCFAQNGWLSRLA